MLCEIFKGRKQPPFVVRCPKIICFQNRLFRVLGVNQSKSFEKIVEVTRDLKTKQKHCNERL